MKTIYLVRHGETTHNKKPERIQDGTTLLTEQGQRQAVRVAERLQNLDFQNLIVSDYERTKQTAEPIVKLSGLTPEYTELFREVRRPSVFFHELRGSDQVQSFLKQESDNFAVDPAVHHSDEENFIDASDRAKQALRYLETLDGDAVVVSHGHFIRHMTAQVTTGFSLDGPLWQKMSKSAVASNTGITTLQFFPDESHWRILTYNDHAHFAE